MASVITFDGLKVTSLGRDSATCTPVAAHSPTLNQEVTVCAEDVERATARPGGAEPLPGAAKPARRGRGRPKGSTVKAGAQRPRVTPCMTTRKVENRSGRQVCRCADAGNTQILPNYRCGMPRTSR